jgi:hypothetical protein
MGYKRFTERLPNGVCRVKCNEHCENFKDSQERMCNAYQECDIAAVEYLALLEDKFENGTLIELPCKVGDTVYYIGSLEVRAFFKIKTIHDIVAMPFSLDMLDSYKIVWFLTKAEAEQKLKELKGEV